MDSLLYYEICFFVSVALSFAYICLWHDGINVYMTCLFILLPIVCLGCIWMYWAPTLEVAILSNKIVYLAGCFWPLMATKAILSLCNLKPPKIYTIIAFVISFIFYGFALTTEKPGALYKSIDYVSVDGRIELYPEYGWMHTAIYVVMVLYVVIGIAVLTYAMKNVVRASIKNLRVMLIGEMVTMAVFFIYGYRKLAGSPAILYVMSQLVFLIAGYRSYYYNIDSSVMDTVVAEGKLGYITFDKRKRLLGCNKVAEEYFPEMKTARTDMPLDNNDGIKKIIAECLSDIEKNHNAVEKIIPCGDRFISLKIDEYTARGRKMIYRVIMEDDTDHQRFIGLLNREKEEAEKETKHVSDTLHRYIDPSVADTLLKNSSDKDEHGIEKNIAVMFADIRGFTTYSEKRQPREVLETLNIIIETITSCIMSNHGIVDKIIGDCVMGVWEDENDEKNAIVNACRAACDIQSAMEKVSAENTEKFGQNLKLGIGINFGTAIVGNVGTKKRSDYTAIGDAVNVASRLEGIAGPGEILVSMETAERIKSNAEFSEYNQSITLKGRTKETKILKLLRMCKQ